jgi:hypothetical protein
VVPLVGGLAYLLGANTNSAVANIPPKTVFELLLFLALTASAGFGEGKSQTNHILGSARVLC